MKQKLLRVLLVFAAVLCLALGLVACGGNSQNETGQNSNEQGNSGEQGGSGGQGNSGEQGGSHTHHWGEWVVTTPATCTAPGVKTRTCTDDAAHQETASVDPLGHDYQWVVTEEATCTEAGSQDHRCTRCQDVDDTKEVPAKGHTEGETWEYNDEYHWKVCTECGESVSYEAHTFENGVCSDCGSLKPSEGLFYYEDREGNFTVGGIGTCEDTDLVIPSTHNGHSVTGVDFNAFNGNTDLTSVVIPDSVTFIGQSAFSDCTSLERVVFGDGVVSINAYAFSNCGSLKSITIPQSVTSIGVEAFYKCVGLTEITIPENVTMIRGYAFRECTELASVTWNATKCAEAGGKPNTAVEAIFTDCGNLTTVTFGENVERVPSYLFYQCGTLTDFTLPDSVTAIGQYAFYECTGLQSLSLQKVSTVERSAFDGCVGLKGELKLPDSLTFIDMQGFRGCTGLESLVAGNSAVSVGYEAFSGCTGLQSVAIDGAAAIDRYAFQGCSGLKTVTLGDSVTEIGEFAFRECVGLESVTIGNGVTAIGYGAFYQCSELKNVVLGSGVTSIGADVFKYTALYNDSGKWDNNALYLGEYLIEVKSSPLLTEYQIDQGTKVIASKAFYNCSYLTSVTIPDSVVSICDSAFYGCSGLTGELKIPDSVTSIEANAFYNCKKLDNIEIGSGVTVIGEYAFSGCIGLDSITIPERVTSVGKYAFNGCTGLQSILWNAENCTAAGELYNNNVQAAFSSCNNITAVTFGEKVKMIPAYLLYNLVGVTSLTLPEGAASIGAYAFYGCGIGGDVKIPDSVTEIGERAFSNCKQLHGIEIGSGVTKVGNYAFASCSSLETIVWNAEDCQTAGSNYSPTFYDCTNVRSVTVGENVKTLPADTFRGCSRIESAIWNAVDCQAAESSNSSLFSASASTLSSVTFGEKVEKIPAYLFYNCGALSGELSLPDSVKEIGESAFDNCDGLESIAVGAENSAYSSQDGVLYNKEKTEMILVPKAIKGKVTIPDGVTVINNYAFQNCNELTGVTIPKSVTEIGYSAFYGCNKLQDVYFEGTIEEWGDIEISSGNTQLTDAKRHYSFETSIENSFAAQSYHVVMTSEKLGTKIDEKIDFGKNMDHAEVTMGGEVIFEIYHAVEGNAVYAYSDRSGSWLRAAFDTNPDFIRGQDAFASFKAVWESQSGLVQYDAETGVYTVGTFTFTLENGHIATLKNTQTDIGYVFTEYDAVSITLPACAQADEAEKTAFIAAMRSAITATAFHEEFSIATSSMQTHFAADVNVGTSALATGSLSVGGTNYPVMQMYREYANGILRLSSRQVSGSSAPSTNPQWGAWSTQQGAVTESAHKGDLYFYHPAYMLTGGRSDDGTLELMFIIAKRGADNTYDFMNFDFSTMQPTTCSLKIENGAVTQATIYMEEWLKNLGSQEESLVISYSQYNAVTVTKPAGISLAAMLPVSRKEL